VNKINQAMTGDVSQIKLIPVSDLNDVELVTTSIASVMKTASAQNQRKHKTEHGKTSMSQ
jgi:hypothetical protein